MTSMKAKSLCEKKALFNEAVLNFEHFDKDTGISSLLELAKKGDERAINYLKNDKIKKKNSNVKIEKVK